MDYPAKEWVGTPPTNCDLCKSPIKEEFADCNLGRGWAICCPNCQNALGVSLGTGYGQLYRKVGDHYIKVAG